MARFFIADAHGFFTADIETAAGVLSEGMEDDRAASVLTSAMLMVMASLAEGGDWPLRAIAHMQSFMAGMQDSVTAEKLM